MLVKQTNQKY